MVVALAIVANVHAREVSRSPLEPPFTGMAAIAGNQFTPVTASDGRQFIAVWVDQRIDSRIYMNIVGPRGELVTESGVLLSGSQRRCSHPAVVWNGTTYVVAWSHHVPGAGWRISIVRVSADGQVLDATPRTIFEAGHTVPNDFGPFLTSNGSTTVVYATRFSSPGLRVIALDNTAKVITSADFDLYSGGSLPAFRIVPLGASYTLSRFGSRTVSTNVLTVTNGSILLGKERTIDRLDDSASRPPYFFGSASNGARAIVVYDEITFNEFRVYARTFTATEIGPRIEVHRGSLPRSPSGGYWIPVPSVSVTHDRSGFVLASRVFAREVRNPEVDGPQGRSDVPTPISVATYDTMTSTFDAQGRLLDTAKIHAGGGWYDAPSIASNDRDLFVLWSETRLRYPIVHKLTAGLWDFRGALKRVEIAFNRSAQGSPRIAAGSNGYLVVWREEPANDGFGVIMAQRHGHGGEVLERPQQLSTAAANQVTPRVAFNGSEYLVAWIDATIEAVGSPVSPKIVGRRVAADGRILDPQPVVITGSFFGTSFGLASNGHDFAVAFNDVYPFRESTIIVARITMPFVIDRKGVHAGDAPIDSEVEIAASGSEYVVGWLTGKFPPTIAASSVSSSPRRLDSFWFTAPMISCIDVSCIALAYRTPRDQKLTPILFHPTLSVPTTSPQAEIPFAGRLTSHDRRYLVAGETREATSSALWAQFLSEVGARIGEEIRVVERPFIGNFDVALTAGSFAVAYITPAGRDGVPRVSVQVVKW